jgi:hypothetical protein
MKTSTTLPTRVVKALSRVASNGLNRPNIEGVDVRSVGDTIVLTATDGHIGARVVLGGEIGAQSPPPHSRLFPPKGLGGSMNIPFELEDRSTDPYVDFDAVLFNTPEPVASIGLDLCLFAVLGRFAGDLGIRRGLGSTNSPWRMSFKHHLNTPILLTLIDPNKTKIPDLRGVLLVIMPARLDTY